MFRPKPEKPPVSMSVEKKDVAPEKILSPEEREKIRIVKEFLTLAKNVDESAKRDPDLGFHKIDYLVDEAESIKKLYGLDTDFEKRQVIADELLKMSAEIPETEKHIKTENDKVRSSALDIILRRVFRTQ